MSTNNLATSGLGYVPYQWWTEVNGSLGSAPLTLTKQALRCSPGTWLVRKIHGPTQSRNLKRVVYTVEFETTGGPDHMRTLTDLSRILQDFSCSQRQATLDTDKTDAQVTFSEYVAPVRSSCSFLTALR